MTRPDPSRSFDLPMSDPRMDRSIAEELQFHLEQREAELRASGLSPDEARRRARQRFGDLDAARAELLAIGQSGRERRRRLEWLAEVADDARGALRALLRRPGIPLAAIALLALGIGANGAIFGIVDRLLLRAPAHVRDADAVVRLRFEETPPASTRMTWDRLPWPTYREVHSALRDRIALAGHVSLSLTLGRGADARLLQVDAVTPDYFAVLGPRPELGAFPVTSPDDPGGSRDVVLSHALWTSTFARDSAIIGREILLGGSSHRVVAVAPRGFTGHQIGAVDAWISIGPALAGMPAEWQQDRDRKSVGVVGRLARSVARPAVEVAASAVYRASMEGTLIADSSARVQLQWLIAGRSEDGALTTPEARVALWLQGVALAVLLIATANVMNLMLLRSAQRRRETALRLALGIGRARLLRQAMLESLYVAFAGAALAALVATWGGQLMRRLLMADTSDLPALDVRMGVLIVVVSILTALVIGVVPAMLSSGARLIETLQAGGRSASGRRSRVQQGLLFAQITLSFVLLIGAGLFVHSLQRLTGKDLGMEPERVLVVRPTHGERTRAPEQMEAMFEQIRTRLAALPGVESSAIGQSIPYNPSLWSPLALPGRTELPARGDARGEDATFFAVTPEYFRTLGIRLAAGRAFGAQDRRGSEAVMLVDETMARTFWPGASAIGQCVKVGGEAQPCRTVVGVVRDTKRSLTERVHSMRFYLPLAQTASAQPNRFLFVRLAREGDRAALIGAIRQVLADADATLGTAETFPLASLLDVQTRSWRMGSALFSLFGGMALLVAAVGIYTLMAAAVHGQRRELGIRMALGAPHFAVLVHVLRAHLALAVAGVGAGALLAALVWQRLDAMLFDTRPVEQVIYLGVALTVLATALVAAAHPARRAMRVDPVETLRSD